MCELSKTLVTYYLTIFISGLLITIVLIPLNILYLDTILLFQERICKSQWKYSDDFYRTINNYYWLSVIKECIICCLTLPFRCWFPINYLLSSPFYSYYTCNIDVRKVTEKCVYYFMLRQHATEKKDNLFRSILIKIVHQKQVLPSR